MSMDRLPVEILMKIFSYLPSYGNVSLVNKQFYNVSCSLSDQKIWLRLTTSLFEKENIERLRSIRKTKRNIKNVSVYLMGQTDPAAIKMMIIIMKKFSGIIKYLNIYGDVEMSDFLQMLSVVPKVEQCLFEFIGHFTEYNNKPLTKKRRLETSTNEDLNLYHLKTLKLIHCSDEVVILFNRLPAGVLTELKVNDSILIELNVLFTKQTNIKKLSLKSTSRWNMNGYEVDYEFPPFVAIDLLDNQKLDYLEWNFDTYHHKNFETLLSKQTTLKTLKLNKGHVGQDLMYIITNQLTALETLLIYLPGTPVAAFKNIQKLANLKQLMLQSNVDQNMTHFEGFASLDNSRITTLDIQFVYNISDELIAKMAKSVPNLKVLRFNCNFNYTIFNAVMRCFNFIEVLDFRRLNLISEFQYYDDVDSTLIRGDCFNPNLTELKITRLFPYNSVFLKKLIKDYPNLTKLVFRSKTFLNVSQFKLILNGFKKMESLTVVKGALKLTVDDLSCLKVNKNRLKFISLMDMKTKWKVRTKEEFSSIFDVIKITCDGFKMAVDRETMDTEGDDYHY